MKAFKGRRRLRELVKQGRIECFGIGRRPAFTEEHVAERFYVK